jgi:transcriptional regulator with XRE-family HTH domain
MDSKNNLSFTDRIQKIIKLVGSAEKLANNSRMSGRVIGQYLAGKTDPTRKKLIALSEAANVNIEWLATGVGPMRKGERARFSFELLTVIIEGLDDLESALGKKLTYAQKAQIICYNYDISSEDDLALDQTKTLIKDTIKACYNFFSSLDVLIETEKGREKAIKIFTREFGGVLNEEDAAQEAHEFISARLLELHLK